MDNITRKRLILEHIIDKMTSDQLINFYTSSIDYFELLENGYDWYGECFDIEEVLDDIFKIAMKVRKEVK